MYEYLVNDFFRTPGMLTKRYPVSANTETLFTQYGYHFIPVSPSQPEVTSANEFVDSSTPKLYQNFAESVETACTPDGHSVPVWACQHDARAADSLDVGRDTLADVLDFYRLKNLSGQKMCSSSCCCCCCSFLFLLFLLLLMTPTPPPPPPPPPPPDLLTFKRSDYMNISKEICNQNKNVFYSCGKNASNYRHNIGPWCSIRPMVSRRTHCTRCTLSKHSLRSYICSP